MSSATAFSFSTFRKIQSFSLTPTSSILIATHLKIMNIASSSSQSQSQPRSVVVVPSLDPTETDKITDETFRRYYSNSNVKKRNGSNGVSIVWFINDLRVLDNEALYRAWMSSQSVLPVYCVDPRNFATTHYFGFPKTGGGPREVAARCSQDLNLFESWRDGRTGYPLIDANMKELSTTGFMSNRGRQIVCSFLVRDMGIDWRMGAEWFETCLLGYDPCSNYGNWTYGAGVGNDPREDRYFSIPKQAQNYDPDGEYVAYWLPELRKLPKDKRNFPHDMSYIKKIVPLKFSKPNYGHSDAKPLQEENDSNSE